MKSAFKNFRQTLEQPVDVSSLALFRLLFGFVFLLHVFYYNNSRYILEYYSFPKFFFSFSLFDWLHLKPLPADGYHLFFALMGVCAFFIMIGFWARFFLSAFFLGLGYLYLLEKAYSPDPYYMYLIVNFFLIFTGSHKWASVDYLKQKSRLSAYVPYWQVIIFRLQILIIYFFSGFSKLIHTDWLAGRVTSQRFQQLAEINPGIWSWFTSPVAVNFFTYMGMAFDLSIGFLLWFRPTRNYAILAAVFFHVFNKISLGLYVLPWFMLATIVLFLDPDEPRRFWSFLAGLGKGKGHAQAKTEQSGQRPPQFKMPKPLLCILTVYFFLQIIIPLRHFIYPSPVNWSKEGLRFSWHLMNNNFNSDIWVKYSKPLDEKCVDEHPMNRWQAWFMSGVPDMILQYAHYMRDELLHCGVKKPVVKIYSKVAQNAHPYYLIVDPDRNLVQESYPFLKHPDWVYPFGIPPETVPFALWSAEEGMIVRNLKQDFYLKLK